uniref:Uncharacterized protein n=1 Tax=Oryza rufipogon TaxID=4529 RepID=A0A0E0PN39_ORYRU
MTPSTCSPGSPAPAAAPHTIQVPAAVLLHPAPHHHTTPPSKPSPPWAHPHRGGLTFIPTCDGRLHPLLREERYT